LVLAGVALLVIARAGTFFAFGPEDFRPTYGSKKATIYTRGFATPDPSGRYTLRVINGGANGQFGRVSSCGVVFNGAIVVKPSEVNQNVAAVTKQVALRASNTLQIQVAGNAGSGVTLQIEGADTTPPIINATSTPLPNANGWNNGDVTVTFTCSDARSGIATCPAPDVVTSEGADQIVSGTATDRAGNTATASVGIDLDRTAPTVAPDVSPPPNAAGWNSTDVTVTYVCVDALSGVDRCPPPATISAEGGGQEVKAGATDRADNAGSVALVVSIDRTPPTITIAAPTGAVSGTTAPPIDVRYADTVSAPEPALLTVAVDGVPVTDCTAGVAAASCQPAPLAAGAHTITAGIADLAGNPASVSSGFTLNLDSPPVIAPIGDRTALLGQVLAFTVSASDPDGDPVTLMVTPVPLPDHATFDGSTGLFTFNPSVDQVGSYVLTFIASDGRSQATQAVTITVPAPQPTAPTTLSGLLLDANAYAGGSSVPIVGATVTLLGTSAVATSDAQGRFAVPNASGGLQVLDIAPGTGQPAPDGSPYGGFREAITLVGHVDNVVERPFFLPRIDVASVTRVNPNAATVVTNPTLGVSINVPPHTAKNMDGTDFVGDLSISLVPRGLAPAQLPPNLDPALLVTIQPVGVVFAAPVPMTFPNLDGAAAGNDMDLWSLLANEGRFAIVGRGEVSPDGGSVVTVAGGVRAADWHAVLPPQPTAAPVVHFDCPTGTCPGRVNLDASAATLGDGALEEAISTPAVRSLGGSRSLDLFYRSTTADVRPIIAQDVFLSQRAAVPPRYTISLSVGGVTQGSTVLYDSSGLPENADSTSRLGAQFDASALPTGEYGFTAAVFSRYPETGIGTFTGGRVTVVNRRQSPVGAGWGIAGLTRLHTQADGNVVVVTGEGTAQVFQEARAGAFRPTGTMTYPRSYAVATLLADGRVMVSGGIGHAPNGDVVPTAEIQIYDPVTDAWSAGGAMLHARYAHTATLLRDGRVFIAGGNSFNTVDLGTTWSTLVLSSAEVYDPVTQSSVFTPGLTDQRSFHTATLLGNGRVLIVGGDLGFETADLFDPVTRSVRRTATRPTGLRSRHTATLLPDGRVLIAGGQPYCQTFDRPHATTEIYDPNTEQFTPFVALAARRSEHQAVLLPSGRVLLAGGADVNSCRVFEPQNTVEILDPEAGFSTLLAARMCSGRQTFQAAGLPDGTVLLMGGYSVLGERTGTACVDLFDPEDLSLTPVPPLSVGRLAPAAAALTDGSVLVAGGSPDLAFTIGLNSAERFGSEPQEGVYLSPPGDFTTLVRNPDGSFTRTFKDGTVVGYDAEGLETSVTDRNGNATTYAYDAAGRLTQRTDPGGGVWTLAYDADGRLQTITDPATRVTTLAHDAQGNLRQVVKPDGQSVVYAYDAQHRLTAKTDERGKVAVHAYDAVGRLSSVTLPTGEVRQVQAAETRGVADTANAGTPPPAVPAGQVTATTTDGNGKVTTYVLNRFGSVLETTDPLGQTTRTVRNPDNLPTSVTRPNGSRATLTYDSRGNLLTSTEQDEPNGPATTTYTYEAAFNQVTSVTDPLGHTTTIGHDAHGNPTTITDARGKTTTLTYDSRGLLTSSRDPLGNLAQFGYDGQGNVQTVTDPRGKVTSLTRDAAGNVTASQDPLGRVTRTDYDALNRVTRVTDPLNGVTRYVYDEAGNLRTLTDARTQTTTFSYDDRGLLEASTNPLGQSKIYQYDPARRLEHVVDARGQRVEFEYDDAGQLTRKVLKNAIGVVTDTVVYGYDLLGNLTAAADSDSGLQFTYDPLGRLSTAATTAGPAQPATTVAYQYDKAGNRTQMTGPQGTTTYLYDVVNRLATLTSLEGTFTFGYDDAGRRTSLIIPNGTRAAYGYDAASQLTGLRYLDAAQAVLAQSDYTYDDQGNRVTRSTTEGTTDYTYDPLDRLIGAVGPDPANPAQTATEVYAYDAVGNRTTSHLATGQVHDAGNRLLEDSRFTYTYDANGNLTGRTDKATQTVTAYHWDVEDRLVAVHTPAQTVTFRYDALGRRIEKEGSTTTRYLYDQEDIVAELDGGNVLHTRYTHGPGIDEPLARREATTNSVTYYAADGLGSVTDTMNAAGQVSVAHRYDSYGNVLAGAGVGGYAFTGREWDPETGLFYYRARYYEPNLGRFVQSDPIGLHGGINTYLYVRATPVLYTDPLGWAAEVCTRPFYPVPSIISRHCFLRFNGSDKATVSFDQEGVHPDPAPAWWPKTCVATEGRQDDDCVKREMRKCEAAQYDFTGFNCCHCVEQAMKACGMYLSREKWPNWPINPGPQPGEPGYKP
jgi:RHS repeat-associated protein